MYNQYTFLMQKDIPLYLQAKEYLRKEIEAMQPGENILESEPLLTKKLKMSRETVRKAIAELVQEGLISRWHGKGNFGHPAVSKLSMRYDLNSNFRSLLEQAGHEVISIRSAWEEIDTPLALQKRIAHPTGERFIRFRQNFSADEKLAILSVVHINKKHLVQYPEEGLYEDNIDSFFQSHCTMKSEYVISWPKADVNEEIAAAFGLQSNVPMLSWEEVYYNIFDECMGLIEVYFNPNIMDLSMLLHF